MPDQLTDWTEDQHTAGQRVASAWQGYFSTRHEDSIERSEEIAETARVTEVQDKYEADLLKMDNIVGLAPMLKMKEGRPTRDWSLTVLVENKLSVAEVHSASLVPGEVDGVTTDVIEVGRIEALTFNARVRPALPGYSIGHYNITAGTFGCLVRDIRRCCNPEEKSPNDYLILSNNHVLADSNNGTPGDPILQPGPHDGGSNPNDRVARLERFEPISLNGYNLVDAAVARPTSSRNVTASIIGQVIPQGVDQAFVGVPVIKAGRTTQITSGRVLATNATVNVNFGQLGVAIFRHQIITTGMAAGGDSGSLLMDGNLNAVGLLFAGSAYVTYHNHIADVEVALGVRPMTAPRFG